MSHTKILEKMTQGARDTLPYLETLGRFGAAASAIPTLTSAVPDLRPEKPLPPGITIEEQACLTLARIEYLLAYLECLSSADPVACEETAWQTYCAAREVCLAPASASP